MTNLFIALAVGTIILDEHFPNTLTSALTIVGCGAAIIAMAKDFWIRFRNEKTAHN